jgi:hypothetical protein
MFADRTEISEQVFHLVVHSISLTDHQRLGIAKPFDAAWPANGLPSIGRYDRFNDVD